MSHRIRKEGKTFFRELKDETNLVIETEVDEVVASIHRELKVQFTEHHFEEHHPYGSTTAVEHLMDIEDEQYFLDGKQVSYSELKEILGSETLLESLLASILERAIEI